MRPSRSVSVLILLQVADEFRVRELVESAFVQVTCPAKSAHVPDIPQSTAIMAQLVVKTAAPDLPQPNVSLSAPPSTVPAVSPESITDPASIAGLKARLAALQVWARPPQSVVLAHALPQAARMAAFAIIHNHLNGRDSHVRQMRVYSSRAHAFLHFIFVTI